MIYVNGPCNLFLGWNVSSTLTFFWLGQTREGVEVHIEDHEAEVHVDCSGPSVPFDRQFMGKSAEINFQLESYVETVLNQLRAGSPTYTEGLIPANSIGSLRRLEGLNFQVALTAPYSVTHTEYASLATYPMNTGYLFGNAKPSRAITELLSTREKHPNVMLHADPVWSLTDGSGVLYTRNLSGLTLPAIPSY